MTNKTWGIFEVEAKSFVPYVGTWDARSQRCNRLPWLGARLCSQSGEDGPDGSQGLPRARSFISRLNGRVLIR